MKPRTLALVALGGALLALLLWSLLGVDPASTAAQPADAPRSSQVGPPGSDASGPPASEGPISHKTPGAHTRVPRQAQPTSATTAPSPRPAASTDAPPSGGLRDRRANPGPDGAATLAEISARVDDVRDDIAACIQAWKEQDPTLTGDVMVRFQIDADGLQDAWVEDWSSVPAGPLSCFGAAVYAVDWSGISDAPAEVSFPFSVASDAAPPAP